MKPINQIMFSELQAYLTEKDCFGMTVHKKENVLIYTFLRYYNKKNLSLSVLVSRKTKHVISVKSGDTVYTDFDELKELVEK